MNARTYLLAALVAIGMIGWTALVLAGKAPPDSLVTALQQGVIAGGTALLALIDPKA